MNVSLEPGLSPPRRLGDREMLLAYLARQRELVFWKCAGLDDDLARAQATPSGLTVHGIVRHLENVERAWLRMHFAGEQHLSFDWTDEDPNAELHPPRDTPLATLLASYRDEIARCDEVVAAHELHDVAVTRDHSLRWIVLHLIEEISRHLGHLDLLCELADGRTGEEPEGGTAPGDDA